MLARPLQNASRYWHTLRHLKPVQFYGRAWHRLYRPGIDKRPAPGLRKLGGKWALPAAQPAMMIAPDRFRFLNHDGSVEDASGWNAAGQSRLWLYNLHYFDDLNAEGSDARLVWHRSLITRWIEENPPAHGYGWEPYPVSLRIVNWIKWALAGNELQPGWQQSLAVQVRYLSRRLEWHLLGNHLLANAKALVFAGLFFEGPEAGWWLDKGLSILAREIPEQILPDGGHFERSPMYHSIILEDMLDLINLANAYPDQVPQAVAEQWREVAQRMCAWLSAMCHPDGEISFFNDAAFGIAAEPRLLQAYAERLGIAAPVAPTAEITHLKESGYIRVQRDDLIAIIDVAPVGPDYVPGHAHADTLSFEMSLFGQRVVVNSGTSQYDVGPQRIYQRSTAAHSTLEVDGESSSEVWSGFRVARRARPFGLEITNKAGIITVSCSHDGYRRLKNPVIHRRTWRFDSRSLEITDRINGEYGQAVSRLHLAPQCSATRTEHGFIIAVGDTSAIECRCEAGEANLSGGSWYPGFNLSVPNTCLEVRPGSDQTARAVFQWG